MKIIIGVQSLAVVRSCGFGWRGERGEKGGKGRGERGEGREGERREGSGERFE